MSEHLIQAHAGAVVKALRAGQRARMPALPFSCWATFMSAVWAGLSQPE